MPAVEYQEALRRAVLLSKRSPPSKGAFAVGAILFDATGREIATGYSRETDSHVHAEEVAIAKALAAGYSCAGGVIVSSLEPCGRRLSGRVSCADHIIAAGITTVVFALPEPPVFLERSGEMRLKQANINVIVLPEFAAAVAAINQLPLSLIQKL